MKKDYSQAIGIAKFVSLIGWIAVIFGVFGVFFIFGGGEDIVRKVGATAGIIVGQTARATMDNANYSAAILEELKSQN